MNNDIISTQNFQFNLPIKILLTPIKLTGGFSQYSFGSFSTPLIYQLEKYKKDINVYLKYRINGKENEVIIPLKRYVKKGFIQ